MTRKRDIDDDAFDERGLLRDGAVYRVPMHLRDSLLTPLQRAVAEDRIARDLGLSDALAAHKPGYRLGDSISERAKLSAYDAMVNDMSNAWRRDSQPPGAYPLSVGEGTVCTIDGRAGHLRKTDSGDWLECVPDQESSEDAVPSRMMDAATSWRIRSAAFEDYVNDLTSAWRKPSGA
jgi:hypothetical protein